MVVSYEVEIASVVASPLAVVRVTATMADLARVIPAALDKVYAAFGGHNDEIMGHNVVFYPHGAELVTAKGAAIECGVQMKAPFASRDDIAASATPAGRVCHVVHWGDYARMGEAHAAIHRFCAAHGHNLTDVNWEIYGDWSDDPLRRRTDIYYLLA
jgi:effector-binding domain-containing protein